MGARVSRVFRNFNLENRVHREIGKPKPSAAPRHPSTNADPEINETIHQKDEPLAILLRTVYVNSVGPPQQQKDVPALMEEERRLPKSSLQGNPFGFSDVQNVPKGKLSIVEALTVLNNHKRSPKTWTAEKLAQEYCLDLQHTKALLEFFIPFEVKIIPPKSEDKKRIKAT
ncbi:NADH dehydrogenase [ubiquinone] 1 alpha subcomplex assembly factor 4 [Acipenser oxyrinchus oxyrinchus]|uniref:NADH dehydrogenase [ubiquinone] 1 alpha subcomplex assembly factor 4 n=1 Tax=Acipenser oxyrinchus oxyrinchus TaxID=40147 RepID=A0AAD8LN09_ACIOX|nr:NADH dehydrogenase [ubiquinone] 1 alpha subcomplex assembly factor 4 [Acipenser oxyrinchus oxyrinchus]